MPAAPSRAPVSALALAALLGTAGVAHLRAPHVFDDLVPSRLGPPRPWVIGSGLAELACAAAVAVPRSRRIGALATAALFVAVFPGNVRMALDARAGAPSWVRRPLVAWARLPLQVPLVLWAWSVSRGSSLTCADGPATRPRRPGRPGPRTGRALANLRR